MSASDTTLHLIGLTETGKTNFLVALDIILDHPCDEDGLVHSGSADDRSYLAPLREPYCKSGTGLLVVGAKQAWRRSRSVRPVFLEMKSGWIS